MNSTPLKTLEGIDSLSLIKEAQEISAGVTSWKKHSPFHFKVPQAADKVKVDIYTNNFNEDFWVGRRNDFVELSGAGRKSLAEQLAEYSIGSVSDLGKCHTEYEKHYIEELIDFKLTPFVLENPPAEFECFLYLAELHYQLQWPLKKRRFTNLVHVAKSRDGTTGYVVSVAIDPSLIPNSGPEPDYVLGQYTSVEELKFDAEKDTLVWFMATASDAKGNVPLWLAKRSINGVVAKDVPHFLNWAAQK